MLRLIDGGLAFARPSAPAAGPDKDDVRREAQRRLNAAGYHVWRIRETATGARMPQELRYLAMQIGYVAEAISGQSPIPRDYAADCYWPDQSVQAGSRG